MIPPIVYLPAYRTDALRLLMLVRRSAAEDRDAFARLYRTLLPDVSTTVREQLTDAGEIAEATAATFVEVWNDAGLNTARDTDVAGWVTGIAERRAADPPSTVAADSPCAVLEQLLSQPSPRRPRR